jgi:hypothetical protein
VATGTDPDGFFGLAGRALDRYVDASRTREIKYRLSAVFFGLTFLLSNGFVLLVNCWPYPYYTPDVPFRAASVAFAVGEAVWLWWFRAYVARNRWT